MNSATLAVALSAVLLVPAVRWCSIPWEQTRVECVLQCSMTREDRCANAFASSIGPGCRADAADAEPATCAAMEDGDTPECGAGSCPLSPSSSETGKHGRAYVLGDIPGGTLLRGLGKLAVDLAQLADRAAAPIRVEIPSRPTLRPPDPEIRPPTIAWRSVRLARAPPLA